MYQAIIFDFDGTMVNTESIYWDVARTQARNHGRPISEATLGRMTGISRMDSIGIFALECGITDVTPQDLLIEREIMMLQRYAQGVQPMPGLIETLSQFHGRIKLAIGTSSPKNFIDVILNGLQIADMFNVIQGCEGIRRGKPDPETYLTAIAKLNVPANDCIILEDSAMGALAGHRAGAYVIAVPSEFTMKQDFQCADARATNLQEAAIEIERLLTAK